MGSRVRLAESRIEPDGKSRRRLMAGWRCTRLCRSRRGRAAATRCRRANPWSSAKTDRVEFAGRPFGLWAAGFPKGIVADLAQGSVGSGQGGVSWSPLAQARPRDGPVRGAIDGQCVAGNDHVGSRNSRPFAVQALAPSLGDPGARCQFKSGRIAAHRPQCRVSAPSATAKLRPGDAGQPRGGQASSVSHCRLMPGLAGALVFSGSTTRAGAGIRHKEPG
jgi:hypothetical protein